MSVPVSIVIPVYNGAKTIAQTIRAALLQDCDSPVEVIVVDDGSIDSTAQIVKSFREVSYIHQQNAGPASARNLGAQQSHGAIIFFTDSDCVPHSDWVRRILPCFIDPKVAAVAGSYGIANPANVLAGCVHNEILFRHRELMPRYPKAFGSYNVAIRRDFFVRMGGFFSAYRAASGEDNDLSYKILKSGNKIYFEPSARVDHYHPTRLGKYLHEQFRHGFWRVRMYGDHPDMVRGDDYTFWKDSLEVFIVGGIVLSAVIYFFGISLPICAPASQIPNVPVCLGIKVFGLLVIWFSGVLGLLEFFFSFRILGFSFVSLFWAIVMSCRAFSRTAGFFVGILRIFAALKRQ